MLHVCKQPMFVGVQVPPAHGAGFGSIRPSSGTELHPSDRPSPDLLMSVQYEDSGSDSFKFVWDPCKVLIRGIA